MNGPDVLGGASIPRMCSHCRRVGASFQSQNSYPGGRGDVARGHWSLRMLASAWHDVASRKSTTGKTRFANMEDLDFTVLTSLVLDVGMLRARPWDALRRCQSAVEGVRMAFLRSRPETAEPCPRCVEEIDTQVHDR